jgi:hypothetical protein
MPEVMEANPIESVLLCHASERLRDQIGVRG